MLRIFDAWVLLVEEGGPTPDKRDVHFAPPDDPDHVAHAFTIRVEDCDAAHAELRERGGEFLTPPIHRPEDPLFLPRPRWAPVRDQPGVAWLTDSA